MFDTIAKYLEELSEIFLELIQHLMLWVFDFFTSGGFVPTISTVRLNTSSFFTLFTDTSTNVNIFNSLLTNVILPASVGITIILVSFSLYSSILSDKETESIGKTVARAAVSMLLILSIIQILHMLLAIGGTVQEWINDTINSSFTGITEETTANLTSAAGEIMASDVDGVSAIMDELAGLGVNLVAAFLCFILTWKFFKLVLQYISRYVRVYMLTVLSPLASSAIASPTSAEIFKAYSRMYMGSLLSVVISQALLLSMKFACVVTLNAGTLRLLILYYFLTLGYVGFAEDLDSYLDKVKLNVGGDTRPKMANLAGSIMQMMAGRWALRGVGNLSGKALGAATRPVGMALGKGADVLKNAGANFVADDLLKGTAGGIAKGPGGSANPSKSAKEIQGKQNMPAKDKTAVANASKEVRDMAKGGVQALGANGAVSGMISQDNGRFQVDKLLGNASGQDMESKMAGAMAMASGSVSSAEIMGANGAKYSISRSEDSKGNSSFSIMDTEHNIPVDSGDVDSWNGAIQAVSDAAGGISGEGEFYNGAGDIYQTGIDDSGNMQVTQHAGSYDSFDAAASRMSSMMDTSGGFLVSNGLGYQSAEPIHASNLASEMAAAQTTMVGFTREDGRQFAGALHQDGSVTVHDSKSHKDLKFSDINSFASTNNIKDISFYGNGMYTGSYTSGWQKKRSEFFDKKE